MKNVIERRSSKIRSMAGFTLIELLAAGALITAITAVLLPAVQR